jgi:hypothetical protein
MTWGIPTDIFLQIHIIISLVGILSGFLVLYGLLTGRPFGGWTALFLATTVLTSVTGFALPPFGFDPASRGWRYLARPSGHSCRCALCLPSRRSLALDVHR